MTRLDAIEDDATTLVGWICPEHGVTLRSPRQGPLIDILSVDHDETRPNSSSHMGIG